MNGESSAGVVSDLGVRGLGLGAVLVLGLSGSALGWGGGSAGFVLSDVTDTCGVQPLPAPSGMTVGVSAADIDGDGDVDLVASTDSGHRLQVYRNLGDAIFDEVSLEVGLTSERKFRATLLFDFDGDGLLDLAAASDCFGSGCPTHDALRLYRQTAEGGFVDVTASAGLDGLGYTNAGTHVGALSAGDLTGNGFLDLVFASWNGRLRVFGNNGDGTFTDISVSGGFVGEGETGFYWQPVIADWNNDGLQDVFVAVDFDPNLLYLNNGDGTFGEVALEAGVATDFNEMGATAGDYDNDGDLDLFVTNIYQFIGGEQRYSVLFRNDTPAGQVGGTPVFTEVANESGVADSGWGWGATFFDADNDTLVDLAIANGRLGGPWEADPSKLYLNRGASAPVRFEDVGSVVGYDDTFVSSTVVAADLDRDGALDVVQSSVSTGMSAGPLRVLMNEPALGGGVTGNWLVVRPRMDGGNRLAIGAVVRASAGKASMMRLVKAGTSMAGQEPAEAHFGLGEAGVVDEVEVLFPDGSVVTLTDVGANQIVDVMAGVVVGCSVLDVDDSGGIDALDLGRLLGAYGTADAMMDFDGSGAVDQADLASLLSAFGDACD